MRKQVPFNMRVDDAFLRDLDELRRREPDLPSRSEMLRRLVERAGRRAGA